MKNDTVSVKTSENPQVRPTSLPDGYGKLLEDIKIGIRRAQRGAALSVNRTLIALYWDIGRAIVERQRKEGWGKSVVDCLAADIQAAFPGISGFSPLNIWRMRAFYIAWTNDIEQLSQPVTELGNANLSQLVTEIHGATTLFWSRKSKIHWKILVRKANCGAWLVAQYAEPAD